MLENEHMTVEALAEAGKCTWRTAKKRLVAANVRPVKSTRKSELYDRTAGLRAVLYADDNTRQMLDHQLDFVGQIVLPALFNADSPALGYFIGLLGRHGVSKEQALIDAGGLLMMAREAIQRQLPGELPLAYPDWLESANEISHETGLTGLKLMQAYLAKAGAADD